MKKSTLALSAVLFFSLVIFLSVGLSLAGSSVGVRADPDPEVCDYIDNDGDGLCFGGSNPGIICNHPSDCFDGGICAFIDEGFDYNGIFPGSTCDGIGECGIGVVYCIDDDTSDCSTNPGRIDDDSEPEVCNYLDDDCDSVSDEGFEYQGFLPGKWGCDGIGECGIGTVQCTIDGTNSFCSTEPGGADDESTPEICDGLDNDCDGVSDEDFTYNGIPVYELCYGIGKCSDNLGTVTCRDDATADCDSNIPGDPNYGGSPEVCNGIDDDCDGETDEDGVCEAVGITLYGYPIDFGALDPGSSDNPALGNSADQYIVSVDEETSGLVDLYINGTDFTDTALSFGLENMSWATVNNPAYSIPMSEGYALVASNVAPGTNVAMYYWIDIPPGQDVTVYSAGVGIKAVSAGELP